MPHKDKLYVVTGAASGIGLATAALLKNAGAKVISLDLNPSDIADQNIVVDLSDASSIENAVGQLPDKIDGLANIAGLPPTFPPEKVLKVNILGVKLLTELIISKLADKAAIVNLGALAGINWKETVPRSLELLSMNLNDDIEAFCDQHKLVIDDGNSYFCSKEALNVWTVQNRWTWIDRGIRMNTASPGPVETRILSDFLDTLGERAQEDMRVMDRPATVDDVAPVVAFLLSSHSVWLRGANIPCDGGMSAHVDSEKLSINIPE